METKLIDLKKLNQCKTALDIGFKFDFTETDGNTENSRYYIYIHKLQDTYILLETNNEDSEIIKLISEKDFSLFCKKVIKYLEINN